MVDAVVVNYHTEDHIRRLLPVLQSEDVVDTVFVVDNSGTCGDLAEGKVRLINPGSNVGFARAVNLAASMVRADYLLVINPDVIPLPGSVSSLLKTAINTGAAAVGPRFYWDRNRLFRLPPAEGETLFWFLSKRLAERHLLDLRFISYLFRTRCQLFWSRTRPFFEPFLSGACLLVDLKRLREVFDERYFLYYEDTDLCVSLLLKGERLVCDPQSEMIHLWNQSPDPSASKTSLFSQSLRKFLEKFYGEGVFDQIANCESSFSSLSSGKVSVEDLGEAREPLWVSVDTPCYFEISLNPMFIPYAFANISSPRRFVMPAELWNRLPEGRYFVRLCTPEGFVLRSFSFVRASH